MICLQVAYLILNFLLAVFFWTFSV